MTMPTRYVLLPRLVIENANAISSPYSIGFPAITAWLGAIHSIQRKLNGSRYPGVRFVGAGIISHEFHLRTFRSGYNHSIIGTGNPLTPSGERPPFVPEAKCHTTVSLIVELSGLDPDEDDEFVESIERVVSSGTKIAGGDLVRCGTPIIVGGGSEYDERLPQYLLRRIMPGYALIERKDLLQGAMEQGSDQVDALIDLCAIHHKYDTETGRWQSSRRVLGWIVPIGTGFHGISELASPGSTMFQRDPTVPHRFAEQVATLGEFVMPYRIATVDKLIWRFRYLQDNDLYICTQDQQLTEKEA